MPISFSFPPRVGENNSTSFPSPVDRELLLISLLKPDRSIGFLERGKAASPAICLLSPRVSNPSFPFSGNSQATRFFKGSEMFMDISSFFFSVPSSFFFFISAKVKGVSLSDEFLSLSPDFSFDPFFQSSRRARLFFPSRSRNIADGTPFSLLLESRRCP